MTQGTCNQWNVGTARAINTKDLERAANLK